MSQNTVETQRETASLKNIAIILTIASTLLVGAGWVFNVNAKADAANKSSENNAAKIEQKADKEDVKEGLRSINQKLDNLQDYLMRERQRRGN